jgi:hypothetical protein
MSDRMNFEVLSPGQEFETAAEEFERGFSRAAFAPRPRAGQFRRPRRWRYRRPPRTFSYVPFGVWPDTSRWDVTSVTPQAAAPEPADDASAPIGPDASGPEANQDSPEEETTMHELTCQCRQCRQRNNMGFEVMEFRTQAGAERGAFGARQSSAEEAGSEGETQYEGPYESEGEGEYESEAEAEGSYETEGEWEGPFSEAEEIALAAELLSVSSEAELEEFLGKLWKGIKKVGSFVGKIAKPFSGVLKAVAKKALPFVGGALGSLIPIPGVGTAVGSALGGALSKALEMELGELELEDREFEMARRFVRIAGTAAQQLAQAAPTADPEAEVAAALSSAAQQQLRHFETPKRHAGPRTAGRWFRKGRNLVVVGA